MKTILVTTDFSIASHNAAVYGAALAQTFNARLILFNAYQPVPTPVVNAPVILPAEAVRTIAAQELEREAKQVNLWHTIDVETVCEEGRTVDSILNAVEDYAIDVLVTGIKTKGKGFRKVLGSTVTSIIRKASIPVIIVPEEARYTRIDTIAFAHESDLEPDQDVQMMEALREIAEKFQPKLYLVRVAKDKFREAYNVLHPPFQLQRLMQAYEPVYEPIEGGDITHTLNKFVDAHHVQMLAMLQHNYSLVERWFKSSTTRSMVFETHIPLLILPPKPGIFS